MKKLEKKRLSREQKYEGVLNLMREAYYPMSAHEIGKRLGFANGVPIYETLDLLLSHREIDYVVRDYRGDAIKYYHDKTLELLGDE